MVKGVELRKALGAINDFLTMGNKTNPANFLAFPSSLLNPSANRFSLKSYGEYFFRIFKRVLAVKQSQKIGNTFVHFRLKVRCYDT